MLVTLLVKEIRHNVVSLRYLACSSVLILLIMGIAFTLGKTYEQETEQYYRDQVERESILDTKAHYNRIWSFISPVRPPEKMGVFFSNQGGDAQANSFFQNPIFLLHRKFDLIDVMVYFLGIIAIILSFDAVSGERESGTLRLLSVFSVSRPILLLAKLLAGLTAVFIPLVAGLAVALAYLLITGTLHWGAHHWLVLAMILLASLLHFCCYFAMGLFASSVTSRATSSIVVAFLLWISFVFIIPNISPFVASQIHPVPGVEKVHAQVDQMMNDERDELGRASMREIQDYYAQTYPSIYKTIRSSSREELASLLESNIGIRDVYMQLQGDIDSGWSHATNMQSEKADKLQEQVDSKIARQLKLAKMLSCFSPSANLIYILEGISGVGQAGMEHFLEEVGNYNSQFNIYVWNKYNLQMELDPQFDENSFLDVSDRPKFVYREMPLSKRWTKISENVVLLILFGLVGFVSAHVAFQRYDIR